MRIVLDTNTVVSGLLWDGTPSRLLIAAIQRKFVLVSSDALLAELSDVLHRVALASRILSRGQTSVDLHFRYSQLVTVGPDSRISPTIQADASDDRLLAAAIAGNADLIVSGDIAVLNQKRFLGIDIVSAATAWARIEARS